MQKKSKSFTHNELSVHMAQYLLVNKAYPIVCIECKSRLNEIPDVYAVKGLSSLVIECKTSYADFKQDLKKRSRKWPKGGLGMYRFYFCEPGVIPIAELPPKWGLYHIDKAGMITVAVGSMTSKYRFQPNWEKEFFVMQTLCKKASSWGIGSAGVWKYNPDIKETDV